MRTATFTIVLLFIFTTLSAQEYDWAKAVVSGGTNVYTGMALTSGGDLLVAGGSEDYGSAPNAFVIHKRSKTDGASVFARKYNGNNGGKCYRMITDNAGNIYYIGHFYNYIAFGTDTLFTCSKVYWNRKDIMIAKFSADGTHLWSKSIGTKGWEEENSHIMGAELFNNELYLMLELNEDSVFYNGFFAAKLPQAMMFRNTFCTLKVSGADGSLTKFSRIDAFSEGQVFSYRLLPDASAEITLKDQQYLVKATIAPDMNSYTRTDSVQWSGIASLPEADVVKVMANGNNYYVMLVSNSSKALVVNNNDTVYPLNSPYNLRNAYLLKLSSSFGFLKATRFHWTSDYPTFSFSKEKLIVRSRFMNTMYLSNGTDSIVARNNQHSWAVMLLDTGFKVLDTFQVNTNSINNTFAIRDAQLDNDGNLYSLVTHGKNIIFGSTTVLSGNKSWDHLTVLCKRSSNGSPVGLEEAASANEKLMVYPNPASGAIRISAPFDTEGSTIGIYDVQGKLLIEMKSAQAGNDVSGLQAGAYFLRVKTGTSLATAKFMIAR